MFFSIIIPAYNIENYLGDVIRSIMSQSFNDYEIIIIDDGSSDKTLAVAKGHAELDNRVKVFIRPHGGVSAARNFGLTVASGLYIWFVDGDDYIHPESLQTLYTILCVSQLDYVNFN